VTASGKEGKGDKVEIPGCWIRVAAERNRGRGIAVADKHARCAWSTKARIKSHLAARIHRQGVKEPGVISTCRRGITGCCDDGVPHLPPHAGDRQKLGKHQRNKCAAYKAK